MKKSTNKTVEITEEKLTKEIALGNLRYSMKILNEMNYVLMEAYFKGKLPAKKAMEKLRDFIYNKIDETNNLINKIEGKEDGSSPRS